MPRFSELFSVPDPDAEAWDAMAAQNRLLQARNDPLAGVGGGTPFDRMAPQAVDRAVQDFLPPPFAPAAGTPPTQPSSPAKRDAARAFGAGATLDQIAKGEGAGGDAGYDATHGHGKYYPPRWAPPSQLTLDQWDQLSAEIRRRGGKSPIGKYQFEPGTLGDIRKAMGLTGSEIATPELQDRMGREVLRMAGYDAHLAGKISAADLQKGLAHKFASVAGPDGKSAYGQPIGTTSTQIHALIAQAQAAADLTTGSATELAARRWR